MPDRLDDAYWMREPVSSEALAEERAMLVDRYRTEFNFDVDQRGGFTCDDCGIRHKCKLVYDMYNTDGDCLLEK